MYELIHGTIGVLALIGFFTVYVGVLKIFYKD